MGGGKKDRGRREKTKEERKGTANEAQYAIPRRTHAKKKQAKELQISPEQETARENTKLENRVEDTIASHNVPRERHIGKYQLHLVEYSDDLVVSKKKVATIEKSTPKSKIDTATAGGFYPRPSQGATGRRTCHETLLKELNQGFLEMKRDHKLRSKELQ